MKSPSEAREEYIQLERQFGSVFGRVEYLVSIVPWGSLRHELDFECWLLGYWSNCWKVSSWDTTIFSYFYRRVPGEVVARSISEDPPTIRTAPIVDIQASDAAVAGIEAAAGSWESSPLPWWLLLSCCVDSAFTRLVTRDLRYEKLLLLPLVLPDNLLPLMPKGIFSRSRGEAALDLRSDDPWKFPRVIIPSDLLVSVLSDVVRSGEHEHSRLYNQLCDLHPVIDDVEPILQLLPLIRDPQWSSFISQAVLRAKSYFDPVGGTAGRSPETFKELIDQAV